MINLFRSFVIAFSMYSRLPMPKTEWRPESMRLAVCFFPLIGAAAGCILTGAYFLCGYFHLSAFTRGAVMAAVPIMITGGIHMDGYLDTVDARSSYGEREKKLEILKDPHAGAFAIMRGSIYFLLQAAFLSELSTVQVFMVCLIFVISRALSGLALANFKGAKKEGLLNSFAEAADKKAVSIAMLIYLSLSVFLLFCLSQLACAAVMVTGLSVFVYYRYFSYQEFGGITGDLAGYFVQVFELFSLIAIVLSAGLK